MVSGMLDEERSKVLSLGVVVEYLSRNRRFSSVPCES